MKRGHVFAFIALAVLTVLALCLNLGFAAARPWTPFSTSPTTC